MDTSEIEASVYEKMRSVEICHKHVQLHTIILCDFMNDFELREVFSQT